MSSKIAVIIAAGGTGSRFGTKLPKQFCDIEGTPMIIRSMSAFASVASCYVVSMAAGYISYMENILPAELSPITRIVEGGKTRFESVKRALEQIPDDVSLVAVHDAARPFVTSETILRVIEKAQNSGAAIPVVPLVDSIRRIDENGLSVAEDRSRYVSVQTPQIFDADLLRRAYNQPYNPKFTDDASVVEATGTAISLADGDVRNLKVTFKEDL